ncbi:hypothetical protein DPEC_G00247820 [Dallia pectoralis]|uniref:Uncharacterized protein n=1 Tax=Dallia pectoralis TaxID=75939 RepID=A0ACC2FWF9_DALPE|nr:hypothetical protein DPEC_G00247820 [Dallia pectoralis]
MDDTFTALSGSKWFSVLDLKSGNYQIEVDEADKPKTAFVCPLGFWEFNRMPQGVTNAPSTFQRLMEKCMGDMNLKEVVVFLDDLIVFSKTLEDHEARLTKVLNRLKEYGLKLSPENAFEMIIGKLTTSPVLAFANPALPYILHTDASSTGLGAALYQEQEGQLRVIAYASRGLSRSESRYPAHKLEYLALKWSVTEKFSDYLYGNQFTVVTDSNPLTYILTSAKLDATSYRWLAALSTFSFKLQYRPGKQNGDADALSRRPHGDLRDDPSSQKEWDRIRRFTQHHLPDPDNIESVDQGVVRAICERQLIYCANDGMSRDESISLVESLAISGDAVPDSFEREDELGGLPIVPHLSEADLRDKQRADQCIEHVISQIERGETPPPTVRAVLPDLPLLLRELTRLELRNGILYRTRQDEGHTQYQLVLPEELREMVLTSLHDNMGHMGKDRTLDLARARFYWPRMASDIERKVKMCNRCVLRKTLPERAAPLVNILTTRPLELVCMDFLSIEPDRSNTKDILVITDHFTKYAVAIPTSNQKAQTVAKCLWDNFIVHYGIPEKLHSDQGRDFESRLIKQLCEVAGIQKIRTTPYHPRGNPVERFNRTLLGMLGTLENQDKSHWKDFVKPLVHAYNCTRSDVTGFTPYELMFGRQPRLPVDLAFGLPVKEGQQKSHSQYVKHLKSRLEESYKIATRSAAKVAEKNQTRFDKRVTSSALDIGDRVLVRNVRIRGKHKLADKWESTVHLVVKKAGDLPVYTVKPETGEGPWRTLHRDLLLPCGFLQVTPEVQPKPLERRKTRQNIRSDPSEVDQSSDEDDIIPVIWSQEEPVPEVPRYCVSRDVPIHHGPSHSEEDLTTKPNEVTDDVPVNANILPVEREMNLPDNGNLAEVSEEDYPEQLTILSDIPECDVTPVPEEEGEEEIEELEKQANTDDLLRRSERERQPPRRLDYTELETPLVTVVKSFLQGLTTVWDDVISESGMSKNSPVWFTPVITV